MYKIRRSVGNSQTGGDSNLTLGAAIDFMQDCSGFHLDNDKELMKYFTENNITMFIISRQIDFHKPVHYGEEVDVITTVYQMKNSYGFRNTNIYDTDGNIRISSYSGGAFIDMNNMKAISMPREIIDNIILEEKYPGMEYLPRKILTPDVMPHRHEGVIMHKRYIDRNRHVNNSQYCQIGQDYLPDDFTFKRVRIEYKTAAKEGDVLTPAVYNGNGAYVVVLENQNNDVCAKMEFS